MLFIIKNYFMFSWINFLTMLFWVSTFMFLINSKNLLNIIIYSEVVWVVLYCYTVVLGTINDDLILTSTSFFLLALAGLEFCIGFIITILFRNFKKSFDFSDLSDTNFKNNNKKNFTFYKNIWLFSNFS